MRLNRGRRPGAYLDQAIGLSVFERRRRTAGLRDAASGRERATRRPAAKDFASLGACEFYARLTGLAVRCGEPGVFPPPGAARR